MCLCPLDWQLFRFDCNALYDAPLLAEPLPGFPLLFYLAIPTTLPTATLGNDSPRGMHELSPSAAKIHYGWICPESLERSKVFGD